MTEHVGNNSAAQLLSVVERVERLEEEIDGLSDDKKEVYAEAKANGFDAPTIRRLIAWRKKDPAKRDEQDTMFDTYAEAVKKAEQAQIKKSRDAGE